MNISGKHVRRRRYEAGLKQEELAERAGLSRPAISRIENGRKTPDWETIRKLSKALDLSLDDWRETHLMLYLGWAMECEEDELEEFSKWFQDQAESVDNQKLKSLLKQLHDLFVEEQFQQLRFQRVRVQQKQSELELKGEAV